MIMELIILFFSILNLLILLGIMNEVLDLRDFMFGDDFESDL